MTSDGNDASEDGRETMYKLIATASDATDATTAEVLGDFFAMVFDDAEEAEWVAVEAQGEAREHYADASVSVVEVETPAIGAPEGVRIDVAIRDGVLTVSYLFESDTADEQLYDELSNAFAAAAWRAGLEFSGHAAGVGGWSIIGGTTYAGGFFEQYVRVV